MVSVVVRGWEGGVINYVEVSGGKGVGSTALIGDLFQKEKLSAFVLDRGRVLWKSREKLIC